MMVFIQKTTEMVQLFDNNMLKGSADYWERGERMMRALWAFQQKSNS